VEIKELQILNFIDWLIAKHRATRQSALNAGKTYRSRDITRENGYLNALQDVKDAILQPQKNAELSDTLHKFGEMLRK
jgi:hypothetical protein